MSSSSESPRFITGGALGARGGAWYCDGGTGGRPSIGGGVGVTGAGVPGRTGGGGRGGGVAGPGSVNRKSDGGGAIAGAGPPGRAGGSAVASRSIVPRLPSGAGPSS